MLTKIEEIANTLRRIKYKPNFSFTVDSNNYALSIEFRTFDSRNRSRNIKINFCIPFPPEGFLSEKHFFHWIRAQCLYVETHECDKWFEVDGERTNDPHVN